MPFTYSLVALVRLQKVGVVIKLSFSYSKFAYALTLLTRLQIVRVFYHLDASQSANHLTASQYVCDLVVILRTSLLITACTRYLQLVCGLASSPGRLLTFLVLVCLQDVRDLVLPQHAC
jgi:hypothetical protein